MNNEQRKELNREYVAHGINGLLNEGVQTLINITPTGDERNHYTDVQIHLMAALESLRKAGTP